MFRRFIPNPQAKEFQPSKKVLDIVEASKVDESELEEKTPLDPDIESKLIWCHFNVIKPGENVDERGRIQGSHEDDYIRGIDGANTIYGNHGSDVIYGGDGNDDLDGGIGADTMTGGSCADTFLVGHSSEHQQEVPGVDFITDFRDAGDRIQFESIGGSSISHDDLDFSFNRAGNLLISVNTDRFSGLLAEVDGLNPNVDLWDQVQQTSINTLEVMA